MKEYAHSETKAFFVRIEPGIPYSCPPISHRQKNKTFRQFFTGLAKRSTLYARGESNPNRRNRNPLFYPLNYGRRTYLHFSNVPQKYNYSRLSPNFSAKKYHILETVK